MRTTVIYPLVLLPFLLLSAPTARANQGSQVARGQIIEKVTCQAEPSFSYALYLPSNYAADRKHPILYAFDPAARGRVPVERYQVAAETYGYIVVGSHDSRNGPGAPINKILSALWADTHGRFAIDDRRVYTTGFSGGARVASAVAQSLPDSVAGVIAHGAGFHPGVTPTKSLPFAFFAAVGSEDFNMPEVRGLDRRLEELGARHRTLIFEGDHSWAPSPICVEAVAWMEVQAMRAGRAVKNGAVLDEILNKQADRARACEAAQDAYGAYRLYTAIAQDFAGLREVAEFESKARQLRETRAVKEHLRQERDEDARQAKYVNEFLALKSRLKESDDRAVTLSEIRGLIATFKKRGEAKEASSDRLVARRTLGVFFAESFETAQALSYNKMYAEAAMHLELAAFARPENPGVLFSLGRTYALGGDKKKAIEVLQRSVEKGFANSAALEDPVFTALRDEAGFKKLVEDLKKKT